MTKNKKKAPIQSGAIVAYINLFLNMALSILLTPFLIRSLGEGEYGVYKIVQSFAGQLTIVSFGIATLIARYIAFYDAKGQKKEKENFLFFAKGITYFLAAIMAAVGMVMYFLIDSLYAESLTDSQLATAKTLMIFLVGTLVVNVIADSNIGMMNAHERFAVSHGTQSFKIVARTLVIVVLLRLGVGSLGIVTTDFAVSLLILCYTSFYNRSVLKEKAVFHCVDKTLFKECLLFALAIFFQTIINQVNHNLDNVILGAMTTAECVTIYSVALTVSTTYSSLVTSFGGLFTPSATRLVANNATGEELTDFVVKPGRYQFMIASLILCGFILFGKEFLILWVGESFLSVYPAIVLLLATALIPSIQSVTEAVLNAMLKRMGRSIILLLMCVINLTVSILCIRKIGYLGAAVGTAFSFVVGHGLLINLYLKKVAKFKIRRMFSGIFRKTWLSVLISFVLGIPLTFLPKGFGWFLFKVLVFVLIYLALLYGVGMNEEEKETAKGLIFRALHKTKKRS